MGGHLQYSEFQGSLVWVQILHRFRRTWPGGDKGVYIEGEPFLRYTNRGGGLV